MQRPGPEQYQPRLTLWANTWRLLAAASISAVAWAAVAGEQVQHAPSLFWLDLLITVLSVPCALLRRRHPFTTALATTLAAAASAGSAGFGLLCLVSLATRRNQWQVALLGVLGVVCSQVFYTYQPRPDESGWWLNLAFAVAITLVAVVSGMYVGSRRELLWTLRDRAERAEAEQSLRVHQARVEEQARIAREMHDVLAHRITLVSMHAGALTYRTDLSQQQVHETAAVIQDKAHEALTDLRTVLGVLRSGSTDLRDRPQPTFADVPSLVAEARSAGMVVDYHERVTAGPVPEHAGRTVYRVVQEGLTNARKHAPGTPVAVCATGAPGIGVTVELRNRLTTRFRTTSPPGAGIGLVGLSERVALGGGHLSCDSDRDTGAFTVRAWLPWASAGVGS